IDASGSMLASRFKADGIDTSAIKFTDTPTGTALIFVDDNAENCIAVAPGANDDLIPADIDAVKDRMAGAEYLLLQLEVPMQTVERAAELAGSLGLKVVLNPAPMKPLSDSLLSRLFLITPNETEAERLTGIHIENEEDAARAAAVFFGKGVENVIITLGSKGSLLCAGGECKLVPARKVKAVDTTAAGDVFNGALVAALAEGRSLEDAARFATLASSIAVTRPGAQSSAPCRKEVDNL
ncbi:MAG: bifunctional hydroxymethylpyrimidine kinase/phosphomethylpyrimidine kinase, partial [Bacteroidales bacterium]|nr:bifunctional hydroxymethylpyrimidine kinase/phosphomethylpyrimidine kinase [Bacteroidales bacterium]